MKTGIYKYCFIIMTILAANGVMAQSTKTSPVAFKEINKSGATDNFTIREIKKKELEIVPSRIVALKNVTPTDRKKSSKKKTGT